MKEILYRKENRKRSSENEREGNRERERERTKGNGHLEKALSFADYNSVGYVVNLSR